MSFPLPESRLARRPIFSDALSVLTALLLALLLAFSPVRATAADEPAAKKGDDAAEQPELPKPEDVSLTTGDDLELKATYFAGSKGPDSIPVIIIHGLGPKCNRFDFTRAGGLAEYLQSCSDENGHNLGFAVIVPDLRGHGESTKWSEELQKQLRAEHKRPKEPVKFEKLKPADRDAMLQLDLIAVKKLLWKKNNKKELNLDKLTVIGVEDGAALALAYAAADAEGYEDHRATYGPLRLGNFLKALVLISPQSKVIGINSAQVLHGQPFADLRRDLPIMILAGDENPLYFNEAERLQKLFVGGRPKIGPGSKLEDMTLWFFGKGKTPTKLQGAKLISEPSLKVPEKIAKFMKSRLIDNPDSKDWVWKERKKPHE